MIVVTMGMLEAVVVGKEGTVGGIVSRQQGSMCRVKGRASGWREGQLQRFSGEQTFFLTMISRSSFSSSSSSSSHADNSVEMECRNRFIVLVPVGLPYTIRYLVVRLAAGCWLCGLPPTTRDGTGSRIKDQQGKKRSTTILIMFQLSTNKNETHQGLK
jgi:hypothetical protein